MEYEKILNNCPSPIFVIKPIIKKVISMILPINM